VVVILPRRDHRAVETGYYKATDIAKKEIPFFFTYQYLKLEKSHIRGGRNIEHCSAQTCRDSYCFRGLHGVEWGNENKRSVYKNITEGLAS
jgi:hypothetical protein